MRFTVTVLYDNQSLRRDLQPDWGFAALVEVDGVGSVLFDTGADGRVLARNAASLGVELSGVSAVVISHWHRDHSGGLPLVLREAPGAHLYAPLPASEHVPAERLHVVGSAPVEIMAGIRSTGVRGGIEQALVLETDRGGFVIMGCAHPGVRELLAASSAVAPPVALLGGLHGFADFAVLDNLDVVYPCHCTQRKAEILSRFPGKAMGCGVGLVLTV